MITSRKTLVAAPLISKKINIIWLNSSMRDSHVERAIAWKKLNPDYEVTVWTDEQSKDAINKQLLNTGIIINTVEQLKVPENVSRFIKAVSTYKNPELPNTVNNYAVPSDLYRFYLDGWYADTDATPIDLTTIPVNADLPIIFNASRKGDMVDKLEPSVIGFDKDGILAGKGREILEFMCDILNDPIFITLLNNYFASVRMTSTQLTTGIILRAALAKIRVNGEPILHLWNDKDNKIPSVDIFDSVAKLFSGLRESSWLFSKFEKDNQNKINVTTLNGVTLDPCYKNPELFSQMFPGECAYILFIVGKIQEVYKNIVSISVSTKANADDEKVVSNFNLFPSSTLIIPQPVVEKVKPENTFSSIGRNT